MKAVAGDVIGTTDGRYGTVVYVSLDGKTLDISLSPDINEPCPTEATYATITQSEVASIR